MSLNDRDVTLGGTKGIDHYPGVANPTASSTHTDPLAFNFVTDPTSSASGAGAGPNFAGGRDAARNFSQTAGVVEGRPGIIESTNIDPLNENSNKDDGWANATDAALSTRGASAGSTSSSYASGAANAAADVAWGAADVTAGAAKLAYGHAVGDEATKQAGREAVWGKTPN